MPFKIEVKKKVPQISYMKVLVKPYLFLTSNKVGKEKTILQKSACKSWSKLQTDPIHIFHNALQNCKREKGTSKSCMQLLVKIADRFHPYLS